MFDLLFVVSTICSLKEFFQESFHKSKRKPGMKFNWDEYLDDLNSNKLSRKEIQNKVERLDYYNTTKDTLLDKELIADKEAYEKDSKKYSKESMETFVKCGMYKRK